MDKPNITLNEIRSKLNALGFLPQFDQSAISLVGIRGYYKKTLGNPEENDRTLYDDALIITDKTGTVYETFNFNCDPSISKTGVAVLLGNESYNVVKHKHKGKYDALQIVQDKLKRDGWRTVDIGRHGINFHKDADDRSKYSLGCQTLPKSQWDNFIALVYRLMSERRQPQIKYFLIDN